MGAKRVTQNNARVSRKNGKALFAKHLDGKNGKAARMNGLLMVWRRGVGTWQKGQPMETDEARMCEGVEAAFYEEHFKKALDAQNAKHDKSRHKERKKDMDAYRRHPDTCPESTLHYIGNMYDTAKANELWAVFIEFWKWRADRFPQVVSLDAALHREEGAPHVHERHVWVAHDKDGREIVSQTKALEEMGVPRPDEAKYRADMAAARKIKDKAEREKAIKKAGLYNNAKMTYTAECRGKLIELAKAHGFEIIEEPKEAGEAGRSRAAHITQDEQRKADEARKEAQDARNEATEARQEAARIKAQAVQEADKAGLEKASQWEGAVLLARQEKAALEREIGDMREYKAWRAQKAAQEAQEAARREREAQAARERQEAARRAKEAEERARREQEARRAAQAAQEAARPKTPEELYREAQAAIWGGAPARTAAPEPPKTPAPSPLERLKAAALKSASKSVKQDGPDCPGL